MVSSNSILMAVAFILFSTVNGHMIMGSPTPYGKSSLNNSPLAADGSDFPCKQRAGVYDAEGATNTMPIGVNQTLSFIGSATHGGGSCQVSLTTDLNPTTSSTWQVIYSILGGCPVDAAGNLPEDPNGSGASKFQFSIPEGINPGQYTLAWTWFNKVGNREMYMNCAPVTVTAASKRDTIPAAPLSKRADFPPMFVANACGHCSTPDDEDSVLMFPNPGQYVQYAGSSPFFSPTCACNAEAMVNGSSSAAPSPAAPASGSPASSATVSTLAASSPAATLASAPSTAAGGIASAIASAFPSTFSIVASAPVASSAPSSISAPAPVASSAPSTISAPAAGSSSPATAPSAGALTGPCTTAGQWNCIAGNSFQQCASGAWSVVQPMAPGTFCTAGQSSSLAISKRSNVRFSKEHIARHLARSGF
ncbi:hypothetical protein MMC11_005318 [Xylographa trunciseda]|nr:hypothetical protein [Xylographa trunciseda]